MLFYLSSLSRTVVDVSYAYLNIGINPVTALQGQGRNRIYLTSSLFYVFEMLLNIIKLDEVSETEMACCMSGKEVYSMLRRRNVNIESRGN
jgi:hypothetical protein